MSIQDLPLIQKYRPTHLDEIASHQEIIKTLRNFIECGELPHLLFHGPPGTGKTSTIKSIANMIYGKNLKDMVIELNASDERGISIVRNIIKEFCTSKNLKTNGVKLIILDECDSMTKDAQFSLRRIIEKCTKQARFCLICNYENNVIPALQSRCTRFRFKPLKFDDIMKKLHEIVQQQGQDNIDLYDTNIRINTNEQAEQLIVNLSQGDMRKVLNILQATRLVSPQICNSQSVHLATGRPTQKMIQAIFDSLLNESFQSNYEMLLRMMKDHNLSLKDINLQIIKLVRMTKFDPVIKIFIFQRLAQIE